MVIPMPTARTSPDYYHIEKPGDYPEFKHLSFIRRGANTTKSTLYYMKMKKSPVTSKQLMTMFPKFYRRPSDAADICATLQKHGFVTKVYDNCWQITPSGVRACYTLGKRDSINVIN
jgi:hypothetical protein